MSSDGGSIWTPDEERRVGRVVIAATVLSVACILAGAAWNLAPTPLRGWWLASAIACAISGIVAMVLYIWFAIQVKRKTGSYWPRPPKS